MKQIFLSGLLITALLASCQTKHTKEDFQKMEWLLGNWKGFSDGQPFYEYWEKTGDTEFSNINYTLCQGDTLTGGRSKIELRNGKIAYTSGHAAWPLAYLNDSVMKFENPETRESFTFTSMSSGDWQARLQYPRSEVNYRLSKTVSLSDLLHTPPPPLEGYYEGYIEFMGKKLATSISFSRVNGRQTATASTPDNLQRDMPFQEVCYNPPYLRLRLQDGTQLLTLNGKISGDEIVAELAGELPAKAIFKKGTPAPVKLNYHLEKLSIHNGDLSLPAHLYLPFSGKPTGAVIMICGSGQHVKEEYNGWADWLASKGVAVLTYDKRNVTFFPQLNIRQASSDIVLPGQLESDVEAALRLLQSRKEIDPAKIGLLGFSQGAVIAPVVASRQAGVAFLAAVSGNATTDKTFIIHQALNRLKQRNHPEDVLAETQAIWEELFTYVKERKNGDQLQKRIDKAYEKGFGRFALPRQIPGDDEMKHLSTWNSFEHDPADYWSQLRQPAYVAFGDQDWFIPVKESVEILNRLYKDKPGLLTLHVYPGADHFIRTIPDRNNFDFPRFAGNYITKLTDWILKQIN